MTLADAIARFLAVAASQSTRDEFDAAIKPLFDAWRFQRGFRRGWADHLTGASDDVHEHCAVNCTYIEGFEAGWQEADAGGDPETAIAEWEARRTNQEKPQ